MRNTKFENSMALLAALIVIFGVTSAATDALAEEVRDVESTLISDASTLS